MLKKYNTFHEAICQTVETHEQLMEQYNWYKEYLEEYNNYNYFLVSESNKILMVIEDTLMTWIIIPSIEINNKELKEIIDYLQWQNYTIEAYTTEQDNIYLEITEETPLEKITNNLNKTNSSTTSFFRRCYYDCRTNLI